MTAGVVAACPCGEIYELRPEYAGRLLECPTCGRHLRAGRPEGLPRPATPGVDPAFDRDVFLLRERVFTIASKYEVWDEAGRPILYVERPAYLFQTLIAYVTGFVAAGLVFGWMVSAAADPVLALFAYVLAFATFVVVSMSLRPLRHVTVYRDDSRREVVLRVRQDQRFAVLVRTYTVLTGDGTELARLRKNYLYNILRKRWTIERPAGSSESPTGSSASPTGSSASPTGSSASPTGSEMAIAMEESIVLSLLRRVLGPLFGLLRTNFVFERPDGEELGEFNRKLTLFDRYVLDLRPDTGQKLDRRIALATGVMLDTGERR